MEKKLIIPAICCIGYNRPGSMKRLLNSISTSVYEDRNIPLIISIDESNKSDEVEAVARDFEWKYGEKTVLRYPQRLGLKEHCMRCGDLSLKYGALIFLEDDVVVAPGFYSYVKDAVNYYSNDSRIIGISLYTQKWVQDMSSEFIPMNNGYDVFFHQRDISHGQCWMANGWRKYRKWFELNKNALPKYDMRVPRCVYNWKENNSWSKYMSFFLVEEDMYYVCPFQSYATNLSELGVHAKRTSNICQVPLSVGVVKNHRFVSLENGVIYDAIFERKDNYICQLLNLNFEDICVDINGMKYDWTGYKYLLSSKKLNYKIIQSFGTNLEPIELNIQYNQGNSGIWLYEIPEDYKSPYNVGNYPRAQMIQQRLDLVLDKYPMKNVLINVISRIRNRFFK